MDGCTRTFRQHSRPPQNGLKRAALPPQRGQRRLRLTRREGGQVLRSRASSKWKFRLGLREKWTAIVWLSYPFGIPGLLPVVRGAFAHGSRMGIRRARRKHGGTLWTARRGGLVCGQQRSSTLG